MKIQVYLAGDQRKTKQLQSKIQTIADQVVKILEANLVFEYNLDLVVTNRMPYEIPPEEDFGIVYTTRTNAIAQFAQSKVNSENIQFELLTDIAFKYRNSHIKLDKLPYTFARALFDYGLAWFFAQQYLDNPANLSKMKQLVLARTSQEHTAIFKRCRRYFFKKQYDHWSFFYESNTSKSQKFIGESLGLFLVTRYLKDTDQSITQALQNPYQKFENWLRDFTPVV